MGNERFAGSELLFNPSDIGEVVHSTNAIVRGSLMGRIGLKQSGLAETISSVILAMPEELRGMFWANIGIFGGLGEIEGLGERLWIPHL